MSDGSEHMETIDEKDEEIKEESKPTGPLFPTSSNISRIRNKIVRNLMYQKEKRAQKKEKRLARKQRLKEGGEKQVPHTIESLRVKDDTTIGNLNAEENEALRDELECDEFSEYYQNTYDPKVLITYADNPNRKTRMFGRELNRIIPNSLSRFRSRSAVKKIVKCAIREGYTDLLVVNEDRKEPNGLLVIHLPDGPTAYFKISNVRISSLTKKRKRKVMTESKPEVVLNNFTTRLGLTIGRMLGALFHYRPEFEGQKAVTFHNQRDYIFFRYYKYDFDSEGKRTKLRELGPRFTLKLKSLQKGTFNSKAGDYIWTIEGKRHEVQSNRRKFFL